MNRFYLKIFSTLLLAGITLQGCDVYTDTGYQKRYVVESYLVVDRPLPEVRLSHTVAADQSYSFESTTVSDADLSVALLTKQGEVEERIMYSEDSVGVYVPDETHVVQPRRTYRLRAEIDANHTVTATTTVPNSYRLTGNVPDSIQYQSPEQIVVTLTPDDPDTLSRQKQFVFNLISPEYRTAQPTPFYADQLEDDESNRADFRNNSSGLVNEGNFTVHPDGSIDIKLPWIGFAYYGPNRIVTNSIDENLYDFIRSQGVQTGGSTLSPGEIPNVIYNVEGGIGVFGSIASDTVQTYLLAR
mgnify:CR=1 FL=1